MGNVSFLSTFQVNSDLYICLRSESSINSLTLSAILPDKPRQQHNTDTHKILMTCIILIWVKKKKKKLSLLNQIHRENRTSKTVTLRHDDRCAFLRITRGVTQSSGSGVKSLRQRRQRSCTALRDRIAVRHALSTELDLR